SGHIRAAGRGAETTEARFPTPASIHPLGSASRATGIGFWAGTIQLVIIETPFPDVSGHVFDSKWTGAEREDAHGRTFRVAAINLVIAPGEYGVAISKVREVAAAVIISPRIFPIIVSFGGVLPFCFGR